MSDFGFGFLLALFLTPLTIAVANWATTPNISNAELLRFCMVNEIELPKCKIPRKYLDDYAEYDEEYEQKGDK